MSRSTTSLLIAIGLAIAVFAWTKSSRTEKAEEALEAARGTPRDAFVAGSWLVLVDSVAANAHRSTSSRSSVSPSATASGYRITSLDVSSGAIGGSRLEPEPVRCQATGTTSIVCHRRASTSPLHLSLPGLAELPAPGAGSVAELPPWTRARCRTAETVGGFSLGTRASGGGRMLLRGDRTETGTTFHGEEDQLPALLDVGDEKVVLVMSEVSGDRLASEQLSRIGADGKPAWTSSVSLPCQLALVRGSNLVIATRTPGGRAVMLDLATGRVIWKFEFPGVASSTTVDERYNSDPDDW